MNDKIVKEARRLLSKGVYEPATLYVILCDTFNRVDYRVIRDCIHIAKVNY